MRNTSRVRGHCQRGCRSDLKEKRGIVNQKDSNKTHSANLEAAAV